MKKYLQYTIVGFIIILLIANLFQQPPEIPDPVVITIPAVQGTIDTTTVNEPPVEIIYLDGDTEYLIDSTYYYKYLEAQSEKEKLELYIQSIQVNEYNNTIIDNDTIRIDIYSKTRGTLISLAGSYKIKEQLFEYIPQVVKERPAFTLLGGVSTIVPTSIGSNIGIGANLGFQTKKGNVFNVGYYTNEYITVGYQVPIFKINGK